MPVIVAESLEVDVAGALLDLRSWNEVGNAIRFRHQGSDDRKLLRAWAF